MARKLYWTILALVVCAALAFAAAPLFAFRALAAAARDGDAQALAELIDYGAVRASLRPQLAAQARRAAPPAPDIWSDPIGAVRRAIEPLQAPPPVVERYVAPEGLHDLTRGYEPGKAPPSGAGRAAGLPSLRYWGPNRVRFAAHPPAAAEAPAVIFTFQRRGPLAWKLVHIGLPT